MIRNQLVAMIMALILSSLVTYPVEAIVTPRNNQIWHQDSMGVAGVAEDEDQFGTSLATGDFDGNGLADLAVGVPFEDFKGASGLVISNAGVVQVLYSYQFWQPFPPAVLNLLLLDN
jgi:hypothetical protein